MGTEEPERENSVSKFKGRACDSSPLLSLRIGGQLRANK